MREREKERDVCWDSSVENLARTLVIFCSSSLVSLWGTGCGGATCLPREPFTGPLCPGDQIWGRAVIQWTVTFVSPHPETLSQPLPSASLLLYTLGLCWGQRGPSAFCLRNSICLCLFCGQCIYKAQTRLKALFIQGRSFVFAQKNVLSACLQGFWRGKGNLWLVSVFVIIMTASFYSWADYPHNSFSMYLYASNSECLLISVGVLVYLSWHKTLS